MTYRAARFELVVFEDLEVLPDEARQRPLGVLAGGLGDQGGDLVEFLGEHRPQAAEFARKTRVPEGRLQAPEGFRGLPGGWVVTGEGFEHAPEVSVEERLEPEGQRLRRLFG